MSEADFTTWVAVVQAPAAQVALTSQQVVWSAPPSTQAIAAHLSEPVEMSEADFKT